jgi:two-component system sensor histidine kinase QseC
MNPSLKRLLGRALEPSVLRGLLLAQAGLIVLIWLGLVLSAMLERETITEADLAELVPALEAVVLAAQALSDQPQALLQLLHKIDQWNRFGAGERDDPHLRTAMVVWRDGRELFRTEQLPAALGDASQLGLRRRELAGESWHLLTVASEPVAGKPPVVVSFIYNSAGLQALLSSSSARLVLLPLMVSLPLLILPAWLSVHLALRPWRRVAGELARRGANELQPLALPARQRELRPLIEAMNRLLAELREARARERQFVADAAHELRTPLAALQLYAESLQPLVQDSRAAPVLAGMLKSTERSVHLAQQLLALMRSEAGPPAQPQRIELGALVQDVLAEAALRAHQRGITLDCESPGGLWTLGQLDGLTSLFTNLVDNALKYSPAGGCVRLRLMRNPADAGELCIEICDQGPGIPPAWREQVLQRFTRVPDQVERGSGLGLAIVSSVLNRHGGRLALEDAPGGGLRVRVWLPATYA